jgi:hypothetical protein
MVGDDIHIKLLLASIQEVVMKKPAATVMVGAQTKINNQLKSTTASEPVTMTVT